MKIVRYFAATRYQGSSLVLNFSIDNTIEKRLITFNPAKMMTTITFPTFEKQAQVFKVLTHPARLAIFEILARR